MTNKKFLIYLTQLNRTSEEKGMKMNNPIVCEKCEEEKSPFEIVVSEHGINVNGESFLDFLTETTPMVVCGNCEAEFVEFAKAWDDANDDAEAHGQERLNRFGE